jgi:hypothetical protein
VTEGPAVLIEKPVVGGSKLSSSLSPVEDLLKKLNHGEHGEHRENPGVAAGALWLVH